jgi:glycosyltransferase involved in cell wall biosynthesis
MTAKFSISVIFPAYNEVKRITQIIHETKAYFEQCQHPYEIIVSADGEDATRELVAGMARQDAPNIHQRFGDRLGWRGLTVAADPRVRLASGRLRFGHSDAVRKWGGPSLPARFEPFDLSTQLGDLALQLSYQC